MGTIYFWGPPDGFEQAKKLALEERENKAKAFTRDASVYYDGDELEEADRIVLLPSVHPHHAAQLRARYSQMGAQVVQEKAAEIIEQAEERRKRPSGLIEKLRRLPTGEIRDYAREQGIDVTQARDRSAMIAAILAGQQESIPQ